jgi:hypothetical protein
MNVSVVTSPVFLSRVLTIMTSCPPVAVILLVPLRILSRTTAEFAPRMPVCLAYFVFDFSGRSPVACLMGAREHRSPEPMFGRYLQHLHALCATSLRHSAISRRSRTDPFAPNAPQP